jgi:phage shock protein B
MDPLEFVIAIVGMVLMFVTFWILLLRKDRRRTPIEPEGNYDLGELAAMAESFRDRIDTLESILDAEVPDWREQNEHGEH